jgi:hypothetical protein
VSVAPPVPLDPARRAENPQYARWAKFRPGTTVVVREVTTTPTFTTDTTATYRLDELTDEIAVVSAGGEIKAPDGTVHDNPTIALRHARWIPLPEGKAAADVGKPEGTFAEGEQTITVGGKEYKTRWYKSKGRVEAGETETQTWYSDAVPGGLVRSVHRIPASNKAITAELVEVKLP